jgi:hypothetical protein
MGYKNLEQQQQAVEAAKYENAKRQTRLHVYQKYLRVLPCDANDKLISDICNRWLGGTRHQKDQLENSEAAFFERAKRAEEAKRLEKEAKEQADAEVQINNEILRYECYRGRNQIDHGKSDGFRKDLLKIEVRRNGKRDAKLTLEAVRKAISNLP